ncbi:MAG: hypothetical protein AB1649_01315 [Chloroflexota bacterium]
MKARIIVVFLVITLAACAPAQTIPTDVQNTAVAMVQTETARTRAALATATSTATIVYPTPSLFPTQPPIFLTPDTIQVERWKDYQTALAKVIFPNDSPEWFSCEWAILGRSGQEVYMWAMCGAGLRSGSVPVVVHLNTDGSIQDVEKPKNWSIETIHEMFPEDVRNKFYYMEEVEAQKMSEHLDWRWTHPEEPPLIILGATPTVTATP